MVEQSERLDGKSSSWKEVGEVEYNQEVGSEPRGGFCRCFRRADKSEWRHGGRGEAFEEGAVEHGDRRHSRCSAACCLQMQSAQGFPKQKQTLLKAPERSRVRSREKSRRLALVLVSSIDVPSPLLLKPARPSVCRRLPVQAASSPLWPCHSLHARSSRPARTIAPVRSSRRLLLSVLPS